jgi:SAM-dependent methyltransferase
MLIRPRVNHCQNPTGWLGRFVLRNMNARHSRVTDWGLSHVAIAREHSILDVGCGGGRTVANLAALATQGKVCGVDHSRESVAVASKINQPWIAMGRVEIVEGSVSHLSFPENTFDLVTAVETHFWWPDLPAGMREILRVLKPGGKALIVAEVYRGADSKMSALAEKYLPLSGMKLFTAEQHRELLASAGFSEVEIATDSRKGWIACIGAKPPRSVAP